MQSVNEKWYIESLGVFIDTTTVLLMKYAPFNHKNATDATAMNPKYNVNHNTVCSISLNVRKFMSAQSPLDLSDNEGCIKEGILNTVEEVNNNSRCSEASF